jgi:hypothetical protein
MGGKNMVFVEAPATIEAESDAVGRVTGSAGFH